MIIRRTQRNLIFLAWLGELFREVERGSRTVHGIHMNSTTANLSGWVNGVNQWGGARVHRDAHLPDGVVMLVSNGQEILRREYSPQLDNDNSPNAEQPTFFAWLSGLFGQVERGHRTVDSIHLNPTTLNASERINETDLYLWGARIHRDASIPDGMVRLFSEGQVIVQHTYRPQLQGA